MKPETTLFMLMSVDGKISTGSFDERDVDKDIPNIPDLEKGIEQYYKLEQKTDIYSFNTGRVFEKIGVNEKKVFQNDIPVHFILVDNKPHLTKEGVEHLLEKCGGVIIITNNQSHPAFGIDSKKLQILASAGDINFNYVFAKLREAGVDKMTIQSGGTMNALLLRAGLIDRIKIVVAPALFGGRYTSSLIDGVSLETKEDLMNIKTLHLDEVTKLENSYLLLEYTVKN